MSPKPLVIWFSCISAILVIVGVVFAFFGLQILPVDRGTLLPWQSAIYGAIMMGWARPFGASVELRFGEAIPS
jgi:hypothetical protein